MKNFIFKIKPLLLILIIIFSKQVFAQQRSTTATSPKHPSLKASDSWFADAQTFLDATSCNFTGANGKFAAANPKEKLSFGIEGMTLNIRPASGTAFSCAAITLEKISKNNSTELYAASPEIFQKDNYLKYDYSSFSIEYISSVGGLRQNFIVHTKPAGSEKLTVGLSVNGDLEPQTDNRRTLLLNDSKGRTVLHYDDLIVWDATNKKLDAYMKKTGNASFEIIVNDESAVYPVTIDPLTHAEEWFTSANGVLSGLNPAQTIDAVYGYTVYGLGDINGDGFDDVAIGAPAAAAILPGPVTVAGAGAVFLYFGSTTGLPTVPSRILRSAVPVANALFGYSIAAGNVTGNTRKDLLIGAPGESYTATVATGIPILPSTTATVSAGKVYLYDGQVITGVGPYTSSSLFLDGQLYFNNGAAGILSSNINVNALFGFSLSVTEDMTGDGFGEILIGAPGYADANIVLIKTGAAFIYRSDDINSNSATRLDAPNLLSFPSLPLLSLNGLLFGFSVDGAGDYNQDGLPDVVVGAPGGLGLGVNGFLGGSAYVFTGLPAGGGVNTTASVRLTSASGLTGSVANLFGFKVKGLRNAAGNRNGNILVGSPASNVLSSILNGLKLKSGDLNIFTGKNSPSATETPIQTFASPRGTSITSILAGRDIDATLLFGAAVDNSGDNDCDGFADLLVGEPLSTGVGLIGVNAVGGAAYIFRGKPDGTFFTTPYWSLENNVSFDAGVNAGSLLGYSVAGAGSVRGAGNGIRVLVGAPGAALDYSTGILNLGNTLSTTFDFAAGNNGLGKAYTYNFNNCAVVGVTLAEFNATAKECGAFVSWKIATETGINSTEIEQSIDGISFSSVKNIAAVNAGGGEYNATVPQKNMLMYYRLKITQDNNSVAYSEIKKVKTDCGKTDVLQAFPTLFSSEVKIVYSSASSKGNAVVTITDLYGRRLMSKSMNVLAGNNQITVNGASLAAGVYYVQLSGENYKSETVKIVKQ